MKSFEYCVPTRVVFGTDSLDKLPAQLEECGASRVLVVYGGQSAKKSGLLDKVLALLDGAAFLIRSLAAYSRTRISALRARASKKPSAGTRADPRHWRRQRH